MPAEGPGGRSAEGPGVPQKAQILGQGMGPAHGMGKANVNRLGHRQEGFNSCSAQEGFSKGNMIDI